MRTLASTFSTKNEAEAVRARLEAIGVPRDRIMMKDVEAAEAPAGHGATGAAFISVKVTTEQVDPVSQIFKASAASSAPPADSTGPRQQEAPAQAVHHPAGAHRPLPPSDATLATTTAPPDRALPRGDAQPQRSAAAAPSKAQDGAQLRRYVLYSGIAVVLAFLLGALAGLAG